MRRVVLGRKGDQPFLISQDGVSSEHAQIEIDDQGRWWLEDLGSTNGTFVRDDDGELRSLGNKGRLQITEMSFICLGPCNSKGCSFYAKQAVNGGDLKEEYEFLNEKKEQFDQQTERIEKTAWKVNLLKIVLPPVLVALSFLISSNTNNGLFWMLRMSCSAIPSGLIHLLYNPKKKKKALEAKQKKYFICPNPQCSHVLKNIEIEDFKCKSCKNIIKPSAPAKLA